MTINWTSRMAAKEEQNACFCMETVKTINKQNPSTCPNMKWYMSTLPLETYQLSSDP